MMPRRTAPRPALCDTDRARQIAAPGTGPGRGRVIGVPWNELRGAAQEAAISAKREPLSRMTQLHMASQLDRVRPGWSRRRICGTTG